MTMAPVPWGSSHYADTLPGVPKDEPETSLAVWAHTTMLDEDRVGDEPVPTVLRSID